MDGLKKKDLILVIDDDMDFLNEISIILRREGYRVDVAKTGAEAIEKCNKDYYPLLLIDVKLTDMDGLQLLNHFNKTDPEIRRIIITGYPSLENAQQAVNSGAHAYLIKPIEVEKLLNTIEQQLKKLDKELKDRYLTIRRT